MGHLVKLFPAAVIASLLGAALAWASITGSISGVVTDQNGGVIVGAKVSAIETQTGVRSEITTDSKGFYNFPALAVGKYDVEVQASGFKVYRQSGLVIDVNSALRVDVSLQVGEVSEKVTVLSEAVHVETESTQNGQVIDGAKILAIPLNGRSYTDLLSSQPGVVPSAYTNQAPDTNDRAPSGDLHQGNVSVNGQRESSNGFMVNGANVEEGKNNGTSVVPNLDSIAEFRIITSNFDAEYGNYSGGQVNVATRSGTNSFHGSAFEFLRNTDFDARNFFNPAPGQKGDFKQNQFGGTGGGPIKRDKLFFFGDYQGTRQIKGNTVTTNVPLTANLPDASGNANLLDQFQSLGANSVRGMPWATALTNRFAATTGQTVQVGEPYWTAGCNNTDPASPTGCVFPGGIIPKAAISPISSKLLGFIPAPNAVNANFNFSSSLPQRLTDNKGAIRIDDNTRFGVISGYYFLDDYTLSNPIPSNIGANVPGFGAATSGRAQLGTIADTKTFGSTAVNEFRISYTRSAANIGKPSQGVAPGTMSKLGFTAPATVNGVFNGGIAPVDPALDGVPTVTFNTIGTVLGIPSVTTGQFNNTYQIQDNFTKVLGTHTWKFGGQFHYDQINERNLFGEDGTFLFDGTETGVDLADFLLGAVGNGSSGAFTQASKQLLDSRSKYFGVFAQDSWRVKSSLTFNYGLRWEFGQPWYDTQNKISTVVPGQQSVVFANAPKGLLFPGDKGIPQTLAPTQYDAFSPRIGLAYSPGMSEGTLSKLTGGPGKTSIRAGFGIFYTAFEDLSQFQEVGDLPFGLFWAPPGQKFFEAPFFDRITGSDGQVFPFVLPTNASPQHPNSMFQFAPFEPLAGNAEVAFWPTNRLPYAEHFDFMVQRQLSANTLLSAGYIGTLGHKLIGFVNYNPSDHNLCSFLIDPLVSGTPNPHLAPGSPGCSPGNEDGGPFILAPGVAAPGYPGITSFATTRLLSGLNNASDSPVPFGNNAAEKTIANSAYHSFQVTLRHTSSRGEFLFGYTYGKCLDNASGLEDPINPYTPGKSRGLCLFDVQHNFSGSFSARLPFDKLFHATSGWSSRIAGGWQVSGFATFATGLPIRISEGNDVSLAGSIGTDVPQLTGMGKLFAGVGFSSTDPRSGLPYFNNCILTNLLNTPNSCPAGAVPYFDFERLGQIGNSSRRFFHGPGLNNWDMALFKNINFTEAKLLELRFEAFNVFNHAQFQGSNGNTNIGNIDSSMFGKVTGANDPRILQIAAKFRF
jgi:hypothetical protein